MVSDFNDLKKLIGNYSQIKKLAEAYHVTPEKVIGFFLHIGTEVLGRSNDLMLNEFKDRFVKYLETNQVPFTLADFEKAHAYFQEVFKNKEVNK